MTTIQAQRRQPSSKDSSRKHPWAAGVHVPQRQEYFGTPVVMQPRAGGLRCAARSCLWVK